MTDVSKVAGFAVLGVPGDAITTSKVAGFGVLGLPGDSVVVTKLTAFAVLIPGTALQRQPVVNCC